MKLRTSAHKKDELIPKKGQQSQSRRFCQPR